MQTHEQAILCAADSIERLRRCDVFRVLDTCNCDRPALAAYIRQKRPDLTNEVAAVMLELSPAIDQTPAGLQHVLPGAEKATDATIAQRRADAPLRPKKHQRPCDAGLFGDGAQQVDLL